MWWGIYRYLEYNTKGLYIVRPMKENDKNDSIKIDSSDVVTSQQLSRMYNDIISMRILNTNLLTDRIQLINRYVSKKTELAFAICSSEENWNKKITNETVEIYRNIDVLEAEEDSVYLNQKYIIKKTSLDILKLMKNETDTEYTHVIVEGNQTEINTSENIFLNDTSLNTVASIENNYNRLITVIRQAETSGAESILDGNHIYFEIGDIITKDDIEYVIDSEPIYNYTNDYTTISTSVKIPYVNNEIVKGSSNTTIIELTTGSVDLITSVKHLMGEWNEFVDFLTVKDNFIIEKINGTWIPAVLTEDITFYIHQRDEVWNYDYTSDSFSIQSLTARKITNNEAEIIYYDSVLYNIDNSLYTFSSVFTSEPDWDENEFALIVLKKNNLDLFEPVEKYILKNDDLSEYTIFNNSKYIYMLTNKDNSNLNVNTCDKSIQHFRLYNQEVSPLELDDIDNYNNIDLQIATEIFSNVDETNVDVFLGFQKRDEITNIPSMNYFSNITRDRTEGIVINSVWDEDSYLGKTEQEQTDLLIQEIGNKKPSYKSKLTSFSSYSANFNNMSYIEDPFRNTMCWIPLIGDLAGHVVSTIDTLLAPFGEDKPLKKQLALLVNVFTPKYRRMLNNNGINTIKTNSNSDVVVSDSITATENKNSVMRELHKRLWSNKIKKYVRDYFKTSLMKLQTDPTPFSTYSKFNIYLNSLKNKGILSNFELTRNTVGDTLTMDLKVVITDIIRDINFNIFIYNNDIKITET